MDAVAASPTLNKSQIRATELLATLDSYGSDIKILSLDCFDTILWRTTATPFDVFYAMQDKPAFSALGFTANLRKQAETHARQRMILQRKKNEVTLKDIYRASFPTLSTEQLEALIEDELTAEKESCYPFPPIIELIRHAHAKGLKIIIVSDTYLEEKQLKNLLAHVLPIDVMQMISEIFCSSEHGYGKSLGLFNIVLKKLSTLPQSVLHIGDNQSADFTAPRSLGLHAAHLLHYPDEVHESLRMQAVSSSFIDPLIRNSRSLYSPFKGIFASYACVNDKPENAIGYAALGPIMYAFGKFICNEIEALQHEGKNPKVIFLMRDAYLPSLVCKTLLGKELGTCIRISRFSAYAASFRNEEDVDAYLADKVKSGRFHDICKQLLLPDEISNSIIQQINHSQEPILEFINQLHSKKILDIIFKNSKNYRQRLRRHLENEINLSTNDTLVFVDLGYTGTAEIKLAPIFKDELNVDIIGRYLIALRVPNWHLSRKGLLDPSTHDDKALTMLVTYIALLEQICTSTEKSVIDYDDTGHPIYSEEQLSDKQYEKLTAIQSECLRFIGDAEKFFKNSNINLTPAILRDTAAINLCRLLFLPTKSEVDYLKSFQFDFNLGTDKFLPVFDLTKGLTGLRRRSWLHCSKENLKDIRTNYPAEWRAASLELALTLMAQHRFGMEFALNDLSHRREALPIIIIHNQEATNLTLEAMPTHDGYFSIMIPIITDHCQVAIQFGLKYKWLELESATLIKLSALHSQSETEQSHDASPYLATHEMIDKTSGLFECINDTSSLVFTPKEKYQDNQFILRIIFRPIVMTSVADRN